MAGEDTAIALFGIAMLLYGIYSRTRESESERQLLVEMKKKLFPRLLEDLRSLVNDLEEEIDNGFMFHINGFDEDLSRVLLLQLGMRFPKLDERLHDLRKSIKVYDEKKETFLKDEGIARLRDDLAKMNTELKREANSLVREVEPLMELKRLPGRRLRF